MPKIPTFTAEKSITSEPSSVVSNIKLSPRSTVASALIPAAKQVQTYAIKKRDNEEKLEEANFARMSGNLARMEARQAQFGYYAQAGQSLLTAYGSSGGDQGLVVAP